MFNNKFNSDLEGRIELLESEVKNLVSSQLNIRKDHKNYCNALETLLKVRQVYIEDDVFNSGLYLIKNNRKLP
jgi:hypothetical protein